MTTVNTNSLKKFFDGIKILRFGEMKVLREKFYGVKIYIYIWDFNVV